MGLKRREALGLFVAGAMGGVAALESRDGESRSRPRLRPPGAKPEAEFLSACTRCFKCAEACPNQCIQFRSLKAGSKQAFTPFIRPRERACTLCGECAKACPTGALQPFGDDREGWLAGVDMGKARVNKGQCYSYNGRTCGACYRACPLAGQAIKIGLMETPHLNPEFCVGCGLCEQACLHLPQAIRVIPRDDLDDEGTA